MKIRRFKGYNKCTETTIHSIFSGRADKKLLPKPFRYSLNRIFTASSFKPVSSPPKPPEKQESVVYIRPNRHRVEDGKPSGRSTDAK
jgi:hypothetical protein